MNKLIEYAVCLIPEFDKTKTNQMYNNGTTNQNADAHFADFISAVMREGKAGVRCFRYNEKKEALLFAQSLRYFSNRLDYIAKHIEEHD